MSIFRLFCCLLTEIVQILAIDKSFPCVEHRAEKYTSYLAVKTKFNASFPQKESSATITLYTCKSTSRTFKISEWGEARREFTRSNFLRRLGSGLEHWPLYTLTKIRVTASKPLPHAPYVVTCLKGKWTPACSAECHCEECDMIKGCTSKCDLRYDGGNGKPCDITCPYGEYGISGGFPKCSGRCNCKDPRKCRVTDGKCMTGCKVGYFGSSCQSVCEYGVGTCNFICHCKPGTVKCHNSTGKCPGGCDVRYFGTDCSITCPPGKYISSNAGEVLAKNISWYMSRKWYVDRLCKETCRCLNQRKCTAVGGNCSEAGGCISGYGGSNCSTKCWCAVECAPGTFGRGCSKKCKCIGRTCDAFTGRCPKGCNYRHYGPSCQNTCAPSTYGTGKEKCKWKCRCLQQDMCRVTDGKCMEGKCARGWRGTSYCRNQCPRGTFGQQCLGSCHCQNVADCDAVDGFCATQCRIRYGGTNCSLECPFGKFNNTPEWGCNGDCQCLNPSQCRVIDGACMDGQCKPGQNCQIACQRGRFGPPKCDGICHCKDPKSYDCDPISGECRRACALRYYGDKCQKTCLPRLYLDSNQECKNICSCFNENKCGVLTGACFDGRCNPGWQGKTCLSRCDVGTFGDGCKEKCRCHDQSKCHHVTGKCAGPCQDRYYGYMCLKTCPLSRYLIDGVCKGICRCKIKSECNVTSGECSKSGCIRGWEGRTCQIDCHNTFGKNCSQKCHCLREKRCDPQSGYCVHGCSYRFTGTACQKTCPVGRYGDNCSDTCRCRRPGMCRVSDGMCMDGLCEPRYGGKLCRFTVCVTTSACRIGRYKFGERCAGSCQCNRPDQCDVMTGQCVTGGCRSGWTGPYCLNSCKNGTFGRNCRKRCHCKLGAICTFDYGECPAGCRDGYSGRDCQQRADLSVLGQQVGVFVGVFGFFLIFGIVVGYIAIHRRRRERMRIENNLKSALSTRYDTETVSELFPNQTPTRTSTKALFMAVHAATAMAVANRVTSDMDQHSQANDAIYANDRDLENAVVLSGSEATHAIEESGSLALDSKASSKSASVESLKPHRKRRKSKQKRHSAKMP